MSFKNIENEIKEALVSVLKGRTKIFLDYIDALKNSDSISKAEDKNLESIKIRGKQQFMEIQNELLGLLKCVIDTGSSPKGIDNRGPSNKC